LYFFQLSVWRLRRLAALLMSWCTCTTAAMTCSKHTCTHRATVEHSALQVPVHGICCAVHRLQKMQALPVRHAPAAS
jgi:hypothetical protein